jgi:hypothetical protein
MPFQYRYPEGYYLKNCACGFTRWHSHTQECVESIRFPGPVS